MDELFRVLSWGAGLQSTVLGEMSARGDLPRLDAIIHADTGWERAVTVEMRDWYTARWREMGLRVEIISAGNVRRDAAEAHIHIPFWTASGGPLRRQCTHRFKIVPIKQRIRELLGYDTSKPPHPPTDSAELWLGITLDEWTRAKLSRVRFIHHAFPLLGLKMYREDCAAWLRERDLPVPPKSACIGCPYRRASEWLEMREHAPGEFADAVAFDAGNRHNPLAERDGSDADELYVYQGCEPLAEADLEAAAAREQRVYASQMPMFACEGGYCGV